MFLQISDNEYVDVASYGIGTWGSLHQKELRKKKTRWYIHASYCTNPSEDDWEDSDEWFDYIAEVEKLPEGAILINKDEYECLKEMVKETGFNEY
jgi:hypothetical protein